MMDAEGHNPKQVRHDGPLPSGHRERNYEQHGTPLDDNVPQVTVDAVVSMLEEDRTKLVTDGGYEGDKEVYDADGGYQDMSQVSHEPPSWTNMENPNL